MRWAAAVLLACAAGGACSRDASVLPSRAAGARAAVHAADGRTPTAPKPAGAVFAPMDGGVAVRLPPGLSYCPMPPGAEGIWREETFYLVPPAACGADKFPRGAAGRRLPAVTVSATDNLSESVARGGEGEARTATQLLRQTCAHPTRMPGVRMLGRPAPACRVDHDGVIRVTAAVLYHDRRPEAPGVAPDGVLTVTLATTPERFAADWRVLAAVAGSAYQCTYPGFRAAPGRPTCPPSGPW
jgi:hypothetical protein